MHEIHARFIPGYSLFSSFLLFIVFSTAFFLVIIAGIEIAKTNISFLALFSFFKDTYWSNSFFFNKENI